FVSKNLVFGLTLVVTNMDDVGIITTVPPLQLTNDLFVVVDGRVILVYQNIVAFVIGEGDLSIVKLISIELVLVKNIGFRGGATQLFLLIIPVVCLLGENIL